MNPVSTKRRPGWVWAIAIWFFAGPVMMLVYLYLIRTGAISVNESQRAYFNSLNAFDYAATVLLSVMSMLGAVFLFLLRKEALYLFCGQLILNIFVTTWHVLTGRVAAMSGIGIVGSIIGFGLFCAVCMYTWRLTEKQVLT